MTAGRRGRPSTQERVIPPGSAWIVVRLELSDDPSVVAVAELLKIPELHAFGAIVAVLCWFNRHTSDGHASVTPKYLDDRLTRIPGFAKAMQAAGWLVIEEDGLRIPKFERWNGSTAKKRLQAGLRKQRERARTSRNGHAAGVTSSFERENGSSIEEPQREKPAPGFLTASEKSIRNARAVAQRRQARRQNHGRAR